MVYRISRALVYQKLRLKFTNMCWNIRLRQNELFLIQFWGNETCEHISWDAALEHMTIQPLATLIQTESWLTALAQQSQSSWVKKKVQWCNLTALCEWWLSTHDRFNCWNHCRSMNGNPSWQSIATSKKYGLSCQT